METKNWVQEDAFMTQISVQQKHDGERDTEILSKLHGIFKYTAEI